MNIIYIILNTLIPNTFYKYFSITLYLISSKIIRSGYVIIKVTIRLKQYTNTLI